MPSAHSARSFACFTHDAPPTPPPLMFLAPATRRARSPFGLRLLCCLLAAGLAAGCDDLAPTDTPDGTLTDVVASSADHNQLEAALQATSLGATLRGEGPYTLFAPTDVAFEYLGELELLTFLDPANREALTKVLRHHIVPGRLSLDALEDGQVLETLDGPVTIRREGPIVFFGEARISGEPLEGTNGVAFPISLVLRDNLDTATRLRLAGSLRRFTEWAARTDALETLGGAEPYTVFAPYDVAFNHLGRPELDLFEAGANSDVLQRLIGLHIAPGRVVLADLPPGEDVATLGGAPLAVTATDGAFLLDGHRVLSGPIETANGLLYVVDDLFLHDLTLDQRLRIDPALTTFAQEVRARPALSALLSGDGPFTVFAFSDDAWNGLGSHVQDALQQPENAALFDRVLRVHVVPGRYEAADLTDGLVLESLEGTPLPVVRGAGSLFVGGRLVEATDTPAANGVLHVMDAVIPPASDLLDAAILTGRTTFAEAARRAGLEGLLRGPGPHTVFAFTEEVFDRSPSLLSSPQLGAILRYHITEEVVVPLQHGDVFASLEGTNRTIAFDPVETIYRLDGRAGIGVLTTATNGFLYPVDSLAVPPPLVGGGVTR